MSYIKNIPPKIKELINLERKYNSSIELFKRWVKLLKYNEYNKCPEISYIKASFPNKNIRVQVTSLWSEAKSRLSNLDVRDWFIKQLENIIAEREDIKVLYKDLYHMLIMLEYKWKNHNITKPLLLCKCSRCGKEVNLLTKHNYYKDYNVVGDVWICNICKKYYCIDCISSVRIHTSDLSCYNSKDYDLKECCKLCLEDNLSNVLIKLASMKIEHV